MCSALSAERIHYVLLVLSLKMEYSASGGEIRLLFEVSLVGMNLKFELGISRGAVSQSRAERNGECGKVV